MTPAITWALEHSGASRKKVLWCRCRLKMADRRRWTRRLTDRLTDQQWPLKPRSRTNSRWKNWPLRKKVTWHAAGQRIRATRRHEAKGKERPSRQNRARLIKQFYDRQTPSIQRFLDLTKILNLKLHLQGQSMNRLLSTRFHDLLQDLKCWVGFLPCKPTTWKPVLRTIETNLVFKKCWL